MVRHFRPGLGIVRAADVLPERFRAYKEVAEYPAEAIAMSLVAGGKTQSRGWQSLSARRQVESLMLVQPGDEQLAWISQMPWLKRLGIQRPKTANLAPLVELRSLECLFIESATRLDSIAFVREMPSLRGLAIFDAPKLQDLAGLEGARRLEELALQRGIWNPFKVRTLQPLAELTGLTCLLLTADAGDESLEPLSHLTALEELDLNLLQPFEQVARLAGHLPRQLCKYLSEPYETFDVPSCGLPSHVGIHVFKGRRDFCRDCHPARLEAYLAEFERIASETQRRGAW